MPKEFGEFIGPPSHYRYVLDNLPEGELISASERMSRLNGVFNGEKVAMTFEEWNENYDTYGPQWDIIIGRTEVPLIHGFLRLLHLQGVSQKLDRVLNPHSYFREKRK